MLERKVIRPGEGARITFQEYVGGWRGYRSRTLIVRVPNSRSDRFRVADVITEGIQGQPQLTFDSREAAIAWKEAHPDYANWNVGRINSTYNCIKIPLEDGSEAWLAESNFPQQGTDEWKRLVRLYPEYFRTGPGFFTEEKINLNLTEQQISDIALDKNLTDDQKCNRLWNRPYDTVIELCYANYDANPLRRKILEKNPEADEDEVFRESRRVFRLVEQFRDRTGIHTYTLFAKDRPDDSISVDTSFNFYSGRGADYEYSIHDWWEYTKFSIQSWEAFIEKFTPKKLGFFSEGYEEKEVATHGSWKIKTPGTYCYRIKINLPNNRYHTFRWTTSRMTPYGGGPSWQEACFLTKEDAEHFINTHDLPEYETYNGTTGPWYAYEARIPLTLVKVPLEDGSEVYLRTEAFPREYNPYTDEYDDEGHAWWEDMRQRYPTYFKKVKLGFFNEDMNGTWDFYTEDLSLTEAYNVPHETFKRVIIKYVKDNGYIKGGWNGRYMTSSPTVDDINRILRHTEDLTEYMCTPEEYTEFDSWVRNLVPEGPQANWIENCINSWNKTGNLEPQDLKNLVSLVSYHDSNIKFQQRQAARQERERQHQEYVDSDSNTWVGEIGDTIEFTVAEAKISGYVNPPSYYAKSYPMWKIVDTEGHTYSWGDTKDSVQIEPGMIIKGKVKDHTEFRGVKQTKIWKIEISTASRLGFFKESLESDWLKTKFNITEKQLRDMCDWQWEHDEEFGDSFYMYCNDDLGGGGIINIFYDEVGVSEFEDLHEAFEFYGEDWCKEWIEEFLHWIKLEYPEVYEEKTEVKLGFFK